MRLEILGEVHPDVANSNLNLGIHSKDAGDLKGALAYFRRAADILARYAKILPPFSAPSMIIGANSGNIFRRPSATIHG